MVAVEKYYSRFKKKKPRIERGKGDLYLTHLYPGGGAI